MSTLESLLVSFDATPMQLRGRLLDPTDAEYLSEPVGPVWTVRLVDAEWHADWAHPDPVPAPVTTIAWRLWHIAVDALDGYSLRTFGSSGTGLSGRLWVGTADEAIELTDSAFEAFSAGFAALGDDSLDRLLGAQWASYADATHLDPFLHAHREATHHSVEIALLRDLYRAT